MIFLPPTTAWVVPTIHPAALLRSMKMQHAVIEDLKKAVRIHKEGGRRFIPRAERDEGEMPMWATHPSLSHLEDFVRKFYRKRLAADFEATLRRERWCVGFWPVDTWLDDQGIIFPWRCKGGGRYWKTREEEREAEALIRPIFEDPHWPVWGQNFVGYDVNLVHDLGWECRSEVDDNPVEQDTMVSHHAVFPELPHSLAFQSSEVTDMGPYKLEVKEADKAEDDENEDDTVKGIENVAEIDDRKLRVYCLRDCFATAGTGLRNERMMA